jgi:hypothetical protein
MKLITEVHEDLQYIAEDKNGKKSYFIEGVFLQSNITNRNGRMYPREIMGKEVARYTKEYVEQNRALGELGHPEGPTVNLDRVSHMIVSLKEDGDNYVGRAKILGTPMGMIVRNLIDEGAKLGVSSRGMGTLKSTSEGVNEVQDDFYLATAADIVADPSAPDAFVRGIMENKEWVNINGVWTSQQIEESKKIIQRAKSRRLEETKLAVFKHFLSSIK